MGSTEPIVRARRQARAAAAAGPGFRRRPHQRRSARRDGLPRRLDVPRAAVRRRRAARRHRHQDAARPARVPDQPAAAGFDHLGERRQSASSRPRSSRWPTWDAFVADPAGAPTSSAASTSRSGGTGRSSTVASGDPDGRGPADRRVSDGPRRRRRRRSEDGDDVARSGDGPPTLAGRPTLDGGRRRSRRWAARRGLRGPTRRPARRDVVRALRRPLPGDRIEAARTFTRLLRRAS